MWSSSQVRFSGARLGSWVFLKKNENNLNDWLQGQFMKAQKNESFRMDLVRIPKKRGSLH